MKKPFLTRLGAPVWWVGAFALGPWALQARELPQVDALTNAPVLAQTKAQAALPDGVARWSREERLGVPSFVWMQPTTGAATKQASQGSAPDATQAARDVLKRLAPAYGLSAQEVDAAPLHHRQTMAGGAQLVRFSQKKAGVEVFREHATVLLNAQSQAVSVGGYLGSTAEAPVAKAAGQSALTATGAITQALADFGFDTSVAQQLQPKAQVPGTDTGVYTWYALPGVEGAEGAVLESARSKPVWFRLPQGLEQAHYVEVVVREGGETYGYAYVFGAGDGQLLLRNNQTAHAADFSYRVWADPVAKVPMPGPQGRNGSPHPTGTPNGYAAPLTPSVLVSLANAPFSQNNPWLASGATKTQGNNVWAYADLNGVDGYTTNSAECDMAGAVAGDQQACTSSAANFDYDYQASLGVKANKTQVAASVVNLFYTTNWLHDWFYDAGFDEAAGNAQTNNFGRGGVGGDAMKAEALDYSGSNNANMYTPADGKAPIMQMYRFFNRLVAASLTDSDGEAVPYNSVPAEFGAQNFTVSGAVVQAVPNDGCAALTNPGAVAGNVVLIDRGGSLSPAGSCTFAIKAQNAQAAGAIAVVVANNVVTPQVSLGGASTTVTIPVVGISLADGNVWKSKLGAGISAQLTGQSAERSSALDGTIVAHEWGHYISNRLIGDSNGLTSNHAQGLGEGWGDFHALLMTVTEADKNVAGNDQYQGAYASGAYSLGSVSGPGTDAADVAYFGIRRYPYSTDLSKNPLTFKHIQDGVSLPSGIPTNANSAANAEVHNMGEVWAGMLWQCYASLLNRHAFSDAQTRMKNYLVAGYKLTPINPTLLEARDALLSVVAASDVNDYAACAQGFAMRGAGAKAQFPDRFSPTNEGVTEDFSNISVLQLSAVALSMQANGAQRCDADSALDAGETGVLSVTISNRSQVAVSNAQLRWSASAPGMAFVDGAVARVPAIAAGASHTLSTRVRWMGPKTAQRVRVAALLEEAASPVGIAQSDAVVAVHQDQADARLLTDGAEALQTAMVFGSSPAGLAAWSVGGGFAG